MCFNSLLNTKSKNKRAAELLLPGKSQPMESRDKKRIFKEKQHFLFRAFGFVFFSNVPTYLPDDVEVFNQQHDEWVRCMVGANQGECLSPSLSNSLSLSPSHFLTLPDSTWIHNLVSCTRVYLYTLLVVGICDPDFMPLEGGITSTACLNGPLLYKDLLFKICCLSETLGACTVAIETTIFLCS